MSSLRGRLLLLGAAAALLLVGCSGSSSHSLRYFATVVSDPGQAVPQFYFMGYVDDQLLVSFDVATRKMLPQVPWMKEFGKDNPDYFDTQSQAAQSWEVGSRVDLGTLRKRYNQSSSAGVHVLQRMYGCVEGADGWAEAGFYQYAYDGEDFLSFDKGTLTWTAADGKAEISKQKLDPKLGWSHHVKFYLERECIRWLRSYLQYGKEELDRTERPTVTVARKKDPDGQETLVCRAHGFYPKEIEVSWTKDGVDQMQDTFTGGVVPNADGTYHKWLSIEVDPKDRGRYRCQVAHDGLEKPLDLAWEEPASLVNVGLIVGVLGGVLVVVLLLAAAALGGVFIYKRRNGEKGGYKATPEMNRPAVVVCIAPAEKRQEEKRCRLTSNSSQGSKDSNDRSSEGSDDSTDSSNQGSIRSTDELLPKKDPSLA